MKNNLMPSARLLALLTLLSTPAFAHEYKVGDIEVGHPWTRATPSGTTAAVGYLTIENHGKTDAVLTSVTMDGAAKADIHEMKTVSGTMTMGPLPGGLTVKPGEEAKLAPGTEHHVMFEGLKSNLKEGDQVSGTLVFKGQPPLNVFWKVEAMGAREPAPMPGMDMDGHHH